MTLPPPTAPTFHFHICKMEIITASPSRDKAKYFLSVAAGTQHILNKQGHCLLPTTLAWAAFFFSKTKTPKINSLKQKYKKVDKLSKTSS